MFLAFFLIDQLHLYDSNRYNVIFCNVLRAFQETSRLYCVQLVIFDKNVHAPHLNLIFDPDKFYCPQKANNMSCVDPGRFKWFLVMCT